MESYIYFTSPSLPLTIRKICQFLSIFSVTPLVKTTIIFYLTPFITGLPNSMLARAIFSRHKSYHSNSISRIFKGLGIAFGIKCKFMKHINLYTPQNQKTFSLMSCSLHSENTGAFRLFLCLKGFSDPPHSPSHLVQTHTHSSSISSVPAQHGYVGFCDLVATQLYGFITIYFPALSLCLSHTGLSTSPRMDSSHAMELRDLPLLISLHQFFTCKVFLSHDSILIAIPNSSLP